MVEKSEWNNEWAEVEFCTLNPYQFHTDGWTCGICGYVIYGSPHYCGGRENWFINHPVVPGYYNIPPDAKNIRITYLDPSLIELQNLLRQLIERVDRLIEKIESN